MDKSAKIEQYLYTAFGFSGNNQATGAFGGIASEGAKDIAVVLNEVQRLVGQNGDLNAISKEKDWAKWAPIQAKLKGLGLNLDDIKVLAESDKGDIQRQFGSDRKYPYDADYREKPEEAPYRIYAVKLPDGRVSVAKTTYVNKVFSSLDTRTGNYLNHAMVFPAGTNSTEIDVEKLDFRQTIEKEYYAGKMVNGDIDKSTLKKFPELQTLSADEIYKKPKTAGQQQSATQAPKISDAEKQIYDSIFKVAETLLHAKKQLSAVTVDGPNKIDRNEIDKKYKDSEAEMNSILGGLNPEDLARMSEIADDKRQMFGKLFTENQGDDKKYLRDQYNDKRSSVVTLQTAIQKAIEQKENENNGREREITHD